MKTIALASAIALFVLPSLFSLHSAGAEAAEKAANSLATTTDKGDEQLIRQQADDYAHAFAAADATAIAKMWTDDCTFTDVDGQRYVGHDAILKLYRQFFHDHGGQAMSIKIESITFPSPNICLEEGTSSLSGLNSIGRYNVVHVKRAGTWQMLSVVESNCQPDRSESLKDLAWLIGDWTAKLPDKTVHLQVDSIADGNFLELKYFNPNGSQTIPSDLQVIGWNANTHEIVSWHFGSKGGFGIGHWFRKGKSWVNETRGVKSDGAETEATYILEHADDNHFSWQSINRVVNGDRQPDASVVQVTRNLANPTSGGPSL